MRRLFCSLVIISMLFSLAGCGGNTQTSNSSSLEQSTSLAGTPAQNISSQAATETSQPQEKAAKFEFDEIIPEVASLDYYYSNNMGHFLYKEYYGFLNQDGKVIIEPKYKNIKEFCSDYTIVEKPDNSACIIDKQGNETLLSDDYAFSAQNSSFFTTNMFVDGAAVVILNRAKLPDNEHGYAVIDTSGKEIFRVTDYTSYAGIVKGSYMFYNSNFNTGDSDAATYDKSGSKLSAFSFITPSWESFERLIDYKEGLIPAAKKVDNSLLYGIIDINGNTVIDCTFEELKAPSEGLIAFKKYGKWGFIDYTGKVVIEPSYDEANAFSNGLSSVKVGGLIGFIDKENKMVIQPAYDPQLVNTDGYFKFNNDGIALISQVPAIVINKAGETFKFDGGVSNFNIDESIFPIFKGSTCKIYKLKK